MRQVPLWLLLLFVIVCLGLGFVVARQWSNGNDLRNNLERAEGRIREAERIISDIGGELERIVDTNRRLEGELENARIRLRESQRRIDDLERAIVESQSAGGAIADTAGRIADLIAQGERERQEN